MACRSRTRCEWLADFGFEAIELPVDARNPFVDLEAALDGGADDLAAEVAAAGVEVSALSNHQEGQLLGPHGVDTDGVLRGTPEEKAAYAADRLVRSAELARRIGVHMVCAFTGCEDYSRWFPCRWPTATSAWRYSVTGSAVLDAFDDRGVVLALECHPRQFVYHLRRHSSRWSWWTGIPHSGSTSTRPTCCWPGWTRGVRRRLGPRIHHVHAKDGQVVRRNAGRSGLLAHGAWDRPDRGLPLPGPGLG